MAKLSVRPVKDPIMPPYSVKELKDVKNVSDTSLQAKDNRNNHQDCEY